MTAEARSILDRDKRHIPVCSEGARERITVLDVMRGIAILLIVQINLANMGNTVYEHFGHARLPDWQPIDQVCWWFLRQFIDETQRGLPEFPFGAGALIPLDQPCVWMALWGVADLYFRRNFLLAIFGLFDVFGLFGLATFCSRMALPHYFCSRRVGLVARLSLHLMAL